MSKRINFAGFMRALALAGSLGLTLTVTLSAPAIAQSYPSRPVRMIVPWPAGGGTDITARKLAQDLSLIMGQPIIVDNRGGANGIIGTEPAAHAAPDGYTIMVSTVTSHASNPSMSKKLPYDSIKDFTPVTIVNSVPLVIVAHPSFPAKSVSEIVQMAKAKPGFLNYASFGTGSMSHLAGEMFKMMGDIEMTHVPYKGGGPALTDTMGGQVGIYFSGVNSALPYIKSGKLKAIAVTGSTRSAPLPDVPTVAETYQFKGYEAVVPTGVWLPAGVSPDVVTKLHGFILKVVQSSQYRQANEADGSEPVGNSPEQMAATIKSETEKLAKVIKIAGVRNE